MKVTAGILAVVILLPLSAGLCEIAPDSTLVEWSVGPTWWQFVKVALILVVVLVLIWFSLMFLRRTIGVKPGGLAGVELLGGLPLGPRKSLQLIRVGKAIYIVGATEHHIGLIAEIDDPEEIEAFASYRSGTSKGSFSDLLKKFTRGSSVPGRKEGG